MNGLLVTIDMLSQFPDWNSQLQEKQEQDIHSNLCYLWHDLTVTTRPFYGMKLLFQQITPAWETFCQHHLHWKPHTSQESELPQGYSYQDIVQGEVPLSGSVEAWLERKEVPAETFLIAQLFKLSMTIQPQYLKQALKHITIHHDALRSRFIKEDSGWKHRVEFPSHDFSFSYLDCSLIPEDEQQNMIQETALRVQKCLHLSTGPLIGCVLFQTKESEQKLLLLINHIISDAFSQNILYKDLFTVYTQLIQGERVQLPRKTTSIKKWSEIMSVYAHSSEGKEYLQKFQAYKEHWPLSTECVLPVDYPEGQFNEPFASHVFSLEKEMTGRLIRQSAKRKLRIADVLKVALAWKLSQWAHQNYIAINEMYHGRSVLTKESNLSRTIGGFATAIIDVIELQESVTPFQALETFRLRRQEIGDLGLVTTLRSFLPSHMVEPLQSFYRSPVLLNYVGMLSDSESEETSSFSQEPLVVDFQDRNNPPPSYHNHFICTAWIQQKELGIRLQYAASIYKQETISKLGEDILEILCSLLIDMERNCD